MKQIVFFKIIRVNTQHIVLKCCWNFSPNSVSFSSENDLSTFQKVEIIWKHSRPFSSENVPKIFIKSRQFLSFCFSPFEVGSLHNKLHKHLRTISTHFPYCKIVKIKPKSDFSSYVTAFKREITKIWRKSSDRGNFAGNSVRWCVTAAVSEGTAKIYQKLCTILKTEFI